MCEDCLSIGSYIISKDTINLFIPLISGLLGAFIGGFIAYISIRASDNRKWIQEKHDRLQTERREAIALTLEWFDPFRNAIIKAGTLMGSFLQGGLTEGDLKKQWPDLLSTFSISDPPPRLQAMLPEDTYSRAFVIILKLENLPLFLSIPKDSEEWGEKFVQYTDAINELREDVNKFEKDLIKEYKRTYE